MELRRKEEKGEKREGKETEKEGIKEWRKEEGQIQIPKEKCKLQNKTTTKKSWFFKLKKFSLIKMKLLSDLENPKPAIK